MCYDEQFELLIYRSYNIVLHFVNDVPIRTVDPQSDVILKLIYIKDGYLFIYLFFGDLDQTMSSI